MTDPTVKPSISSILRDLNRRIGQLERRQNITTDLSALEADIATNGSDITGLDGRLTTAEGEIDTLQTDFAIEQGFIDTLQSEMTAAEADIDALQGQTYTEMRVLEAPYRVYDGTASGNTTITLPTTMRNVTVTGADSVFGSITVIKPSGVVGYINVHATNINGGFVTGNVVNLPATTSEINNGAFGTELNGSRQFRLYRQNSCRAIVDVWAVGLTKTT